MGQVQRLTLMTSSQNINGNDGDDEDRDNCIGGERRYSGWMDYYVM